MRNAFSLAITALLATSAVAAPLKRLASGLNVGSMTYVGKIKLLGDPELKKRAFPTSAEFLSNFIHSPTGTYQIVDLREASERTDGEIRGAAHWPMKDDTESLAVIEGMIKAKALPKNLVDLPKKGTVIFYCKMGAKRSPSVALWYAQYMSRKGQKVVLLDRGFSAFETFDNKQPLTKRLVFKPDATEKDSKSSGKKTPPSSPVKSSSSGSLSRSGSSTHLSSGSTGSTLSHSGTSLDSGSGSSHVSGSSGSTSGKSRFTTSPASPTTGKRRSTSTDETAAKKEKLTAVHRRFVGVKFRA